MKHFLQQIVEGMNVGDRGGNIVFNAYIWVNNDCSWIQWWFKNNFIEFLVMSCFAFIRTTISIINKYATRENLYPG